MLCSSIWPVKYVAVSLAKAGLERLTYAELCPPVMVLPSYRPVRKFWTRSISQLALYESNRKPPTRSSVSCGSVVRQWPRAVRPNCRVLIQDTTTRSQRRGSVAWRRIPSSYVPPQRSPRHFLPHSKVRSCRATAASRARRSLAMRSHPWERVPRRTCSVSVFSLDCRGNVLQGHGIRGHTTFQPSFSGYFPAPPAVHP
jgi:hypothetical protein